MIGTQLGHYRIERLLGTGGMGEVYLADDIRLGRRVALKVLSATLAGDPDRRERFEREARAAAALNHPNIVTIHSVEEEGGVPFLTLELIDGKTLAELIPEGGLSLDRVLELGIPLTDAVGAAHQRGITHRDLKPANVMVTTDGRLKVLDFGLAKVKEEARLAAEEGMATAALTGDGRIVGTVAYMSPEQAEGKPVDQRSDVFSLGIMLYEMATGARPFGGDTHMSTLSAIIKDTPKSLNEVRPGLPRELWKIINRCLAKDVEDRYQTAKDLRNDLRALKNELTSGEVVPITGSGVHATAERSAPRGKTAMIAAGALLVVGGYRRGRLLVDARPGRLLQSRHHVPSIPSSSRGSRRPARRASPRCPATADTSRTCRPVTANRASGFGRWPRRATSKSCRPTIVRYAGLDLHARRQPHLLRDLRCAEATWRTSIKSACSAAAPA